MRWKSVALAGALAPAAVGCNIAKNAARNIVNEPHVVGTQVCITHDLRKEARAAWREVRADYPRKAFTAEFHEGFLDGYVDYLDRGGNGSLPAVPPAKYTRHKKYFTEEGQCLLKDYFLGFKYGQEIAIATGRRQFLTVPVLLPEVPTGPPAFTFARPPAPAMGDPAPAPTGVLPNPQPLTKPDVEVPPKPEAPPVPSKFDLPRPPAAVPPPSPPQPSPVPLPAPEPPPVRPAPPLGVNPPPVIEVPKASATKLPPPPAEIPNLPEHVPTPSVLDDLPVVAPTHAEPPVVPPSHPESTGK